MTPNPEDLRDRLGDWSHAGGPLYEALASRLAALVREGGLAPGTRLPAERRLASLLNVSRRTVMAAYERLRAEGIVETRHGSGTAVRAEASPLTGPRESHVVSTLSGKSIWAGLLLDHDALDLRAAYWVGTDDLPREVFDLTGPDAETVLGGHGYYPLGTPALRDSIARHLTGRGLATDPNEILVTSGAQQAIDLVAGLLLEPGDTVLVEELTYPGALESFAAREARLRPVGLTPHGVDVAAVARAVNLTNPRLLYLIPDCHNPTGATLPLIGRRRLAELAVDWRTIVIDDQTLAGTQRPGSDPIPPLAAVAPVEAGRIVTVGSMSKLVWGGLRVGWIRAEERLLARLARLKIVNDLGTAAPSQLVAARLLDRLDELLPPRREEMARRRAILGDALARRLPDWEWTEPAGGHCLWVRLPGADTVEFAAVAAGHGVGVAPGTVHAAGDGWRDHLRLPIGYPPDVLLTAVDRLADAWAEHRRRLERVDRLGVIV